jgi:hypothetical protein
LPTCLRRLSNGLPGVELMNKLFRSPSYWLAFILAAYLVIGTLYAVYTPAWQVPDEPAHYNYIKTLATTGQIPAIEMGDYDQDYQNYLVFETRFSPALSIEPLRYEDHQPPLYYLLAAPVFLLTGGSLLALRLFSVLLGAGVVVFAYLTVRELTRTPIGFAHRPSPYAGEGNTVLALGVAAFVAFVPQHVAMMAGVENDSLAELLLAMVIWKTIQISNISRYVYSRSRFKTSVDVSTRAYPSRDAYSQSHARTRVSNWDWVWLGVLVGLGLVTKLTFYIAAPLVAWAIIRYPMPNTQYPTRSTQHVSLVTRSGHSSFVIFPALLIAIPWWVRNIAVYGWPDFMGLARHNAVAMAGGQPTTAWWIAQHGWGGLLSRFLTFTFQSFWGQFGWMTVPMSPRYYAVLGILSLAALVGFVWAVLPHLKHALGDVRFQILGAWVILNVLVYLYYNVTFVQHQGRYLFPALIPIGLAFIVGLRQWTRLLPLHDRWRNAALALPYLGLAALDLLALFRMIIPSLKA